MIKSSNYGDVNVVRNDNYQYGVTGKDGNVIVPFGKYGWISGFDHGLARVHSIKVISDNPRWGIIDMRGKEILPLRYNNIWDFFGKNRKSTKVILAGEEFWFHLERHELFRYDPDRVPKRRFSSGQSVYDIRSYGHSFGQYAGSYAQDVIGFSYEVINDAFDGDPDACWNID